MGEKDHIKRGALGMEELPVGSSPKKLSRGSDFSSSKDGTPKKKKGARLDIDTFFKSTTSRKAAGKGTAVTEKQLTKIFKHNAVADSELAKKQLLEECFMVERDPSSSSSKKASFLCVCDRVATLTRFHQALHMCKDMLVRNNYE